MSKIRKETDTDTVTIRCHMSRELHQACAHIRGSALAHEVVLQGALCAATAIRPAQELLLARTAEHVRACGLQATHVVRVRLDAVYDTAAADTTGMCHCTVRCSGRL